MAVLEIIGILVGMFLIYMLYKDLNEYSIRKYRYEFYSVANLMQIIIGDWIIYFGRSVYLMAVEEHGDVLNGQLLIFIGVAVISLVLYKNFRYVSFFTALILSILQLLISIPLAVGTFFILLIAIAALAETKPVYVLNK